MNCEKVGHSLRTQELALAYKFGRWGTVQFIFILFPFFRLLENFFLFFFSADILTDIRYLTDTERAKELGKRK